MIQPFESPFPDWVVFARSAAWETHSIRVHREELVTFSPTATDACRRTFSLARVAVRRALEKLGQPARPVLRGHDRAPPWPAALYSPITHTADRAASVITVAERTAGMGLDFEDVRRVTSASLERLVGDPEEQQGIAGNAAQFVSVFWAKEAIFKAYYPLQRSFSDVDEGRQLLASAPSLTAVMGEG